MRRQRLFASAPATLTLDAIVVLWVALCIALGLVVADAVEELTALSDGIASAGGAIRTSGEAIGGVELPVVGEPLAGAGQEIQETGRGVESSGRDAREEIEDFARLLGAALAIIPMAPVLLLYLPPRLRRGREIRALRRMQRAAGDDPSFVEFLARRAAGQLSYRELGRLSERPWRDLEEGTHLPLAEAELRRVGVLRPRLDRAA